MKTLSALIAVLAVAGLATAVQAAEPRIVTFEDDQEGWTAGPDCQTIVEDGPTGNYWNFVNRHCDGPFVVRAFFRTWNETDPAFIGDYSAKGPVRISIDVNVNQYDFLSPFGGAFAVEEERKLVLELIDYDNPYTDPDTGFFWPWTSVIYDMGIYPNRDAGWKAFSVDIADPGAAELPDGWVGFGGPEDPTTFISQLPPDRTFGDVLAGIDEIQFHSIEPGFFYSIGFLHDIDFDNITIQDLPKSCAGEEATIFVDNDGIIRGGPHDGATYDGHLLGTNGDDVIVGTDGNDTITARRGNDIVCAGGGNDNVNGQQDSDLIFGEDGDDNLLGQLGNDYIDGGPGYDHINGGPGDDTCGNGENFQNCMEDSPGGEQQPVQQATFGDTAAPAAVQLERNR